MKFFQCDAREQKLHKILKEDFGKFDLIMSDMAPNFSGTLFETHQYMIELNRLCLSLCLLMGSDKASLVMKTLQGDQ